ncbi:MAG TPA: flavin reductase family protein, partial [Candidatus Brocadiia bacterium]|nr:flavin reductase family protein [Candidatus Brocadiia bacterium]
MERKAYTVNVPSTALLQQTDFFGIVSGRDTDKFAATGLTPVKSVLVDAPYVKEFPLVLECKLVQSVDLGLHTMFIGEIMDVKADPAILGPNDQPTMERLAPFFFMPGESAYYKAGDRAGQAFSAGNSLKK